MKYIRTKDGIVYNLESKDVSSWEYIDNDTAINEYGDDGAFYTIYYFNENKGHYSEYDGKGGHSCDFIEEKDILKQSDNLTKLCDGYVFVSKSGETHYVYFKLYDMGVCLGSRIENDEKFRNHLLENGTIYGAVWTDKGLIYVAKMNDDGELVLI